MFICSTHLAGANRLEYNPPMLTYPQFSPVVLELGPLSVRWYGLMYLFGFISAWILGRRRAKAGRTFTPAQFDDVLTWGILGVILGARLGYVVFYNPIHYLQNPLDIFTRCCGPSFFDRPISSPGLPIRNSPGGIQTNSSFTPPPKSTVMGLP